MSANGPSDVILDYCNNRMPARLVRVEERAEEGGPATLVLHVEGLVELDPSDLQWDAAHDIARRFDLDPSATRWQRTGKDARGRNAGVFVMTFRGGHVRN